MSRTSPTPRVFWPNRFPVKRLTDLGALAQVMIRGDIVHHASVPLARRLACIPFYFGTGNVRLMHATSTRSGTLWTQTAINAALDLAAGGDGEYIYNGLFWPNTGFPNRRLDWRIPLGTTNMRRDDGLPVLRDQVYYHSHLPYSRIRSAQLRNMRIVVVTRSIFEILESKFYKYAGLAALPDVTTDNPDSFDWDGQLGDLIEFFNSWGDALTWHPNIRHYRYEDMKKDPLGSHCELLDFWGLDVPEDCVAEGLRLASKEEMNKRFTTDEARNHSRASKRGKDRRGTLSPARKRAIVDRLDRDLIHDLGHRFDMDTEYGFEYD